LFGSIINGLSIAMSEVKEREAALITFMVTASGLTLFSIGSAFWGIVAGVVTLLILNWRKGPVGRACSRWSSTITLT
jgi:benzoate membrane transport protein